MEKLLYILNVAKRVNNFSYTSMRAAQELGYEFHIAGNWSYASEQERMDDEAKYGIHIYQIDFIRTPYHPGNIKAYKQLAKIIQRENFSVIHCNTPIGGIVGRLLGARYKIKRVIYQAHGFHFYKGAALKNWLLFYPVEKWLAKKTNSIITINQEDYQLAQEFRLKDHGRVYYVPGVGIDLDEYIPECNGKTKGKLTLGLREEDILIISIGELNRNKNVKTILKALAQISEKHVHLLICGDGEEKDEILRLAKNLEIDKQTHLLGYRTDIKSLLEYSDIYISASFREGLSRALMEAMALGKPCIVSRIRGNVDLIDDGGGILCDPQSVKDYSEAISALVQNPRMREKMGKRNLEVIKDYSTQASIEAMKRVYEGKA